MSKVAFVGAKPNTGNKLALDCTTQQEAGEGSEVAQKKKDTTEGPVCPVQGVMAGAGGLLDVPLHHDEEERLVLCKIGIYPPRLFCANPGLPEATLPPRIREPARLW